MLNWGVGLILAHHGDNYKNELVGGYVQEHTLAKIPNEQLYSEGGKKKYNNRSRKPLCQ